jgi:hypothetical protein
METTILDEDLNSIRVAVFPRLVVLLACLVPLAGAIVSSFSIRDVLLAMREAEAAGISAVTGGLSEANIPAVFSLFLAVVLGFAAIAVIVIRLFVSTTTASPPAWSILLSGVLALLPMLLAWKAESLLLQSFTEPVHGVSIAAPTILLLLKTALYSAPICMILLVLIAVYPFSTRRKGKWSALILIVMLVATFFGFGIALQSRTWWLYEVSKRERF